MLKLISVKIEFKSKKVAGDNEGHYTFIKWPIPNGDIASLNMAALQNRPACRERERVAMLLISQEAIAKLD